jgi:hypothetical protein
MKNVLRVHLSPSGVEVGKRGPALAECVYCGKISEVHRDHVPPKNLFARPRPRLITVPSCTECNGGASLDDEYFRSRLLLREDIQEHPEVARVQPLLFERLQRPKSAGFLRAVQQDIHKVDLVASSGLFVRRGHALNVDYERLLNVVERTTKGLYYHLRGKRLPDNYGVRVYDVSMIERQEFERLYDRLAPVLRDSRPISLGKRVFDCWHYFASEDPNVSVWLLVFYGKVEFLAFTGPKELPAHAAAAGPTDAHA